ncbi:hypothetical protein [Ichthyenterobacterium magnum]|uniref:Lipocalin-like protein n=1 Tax=Ichthyenterobacterium magnum TaxID=1230530 RepID=A0A420DVJ3_9FLAO|nr:hypothetical protein [Ichthyenterobacterium magnum]RKE98244.1 hypothetical protein BXY80_0322 [Ichthyenterobacterium magnum]
MKFYKQLVFVLVVMLCLMNTQCDDDDIFVETCGLEVIIDEDVYNNLETAFFTFVNVEIIDDCLNAEISSSGCDGNSWVFNLVDSSLVAESSPEQRSLKLQLINNEVCLAVFQQTVSFDLTSIRVEGSNQVVLNIDGLESALTYTY